LATGAPSRVTSNSFSTCNNASAWGQRCLRSRTVIVFMALGYHVSHNEPGPWPGLSNRASARQAVRPDGVGYDGRIVNRRRLVSGVVIGLVVLTGLVAAGVFALPGIVRWVAVKELGKATGRTVALDAVELSLYQGRLALRGLRVIDRDGGPLLSLDRAEVRFTPRELLRLRGHITDATFQTLTIRVVRTGPNEYNISDLLGRRAEEKAGKPPALTIDKLDLLGASIVVEDRTLTPPRTWRVDPLEIHARDVSTVAGARPVRPRWPPWPPARRSCSRSPTCGSRRSRSRAC
jgi:hypothetical protein